MIALDVDEIERTAAMSSCECGDDAKHFRACADCKFTVSRCEACGGNKSASRELHLHRTREHGMQIQMPGCETPQDPVLEMQRPLTRGDCEPCAVCQAFFDGDDIAADEFDRLPCGHLASSAPNHCRPCPWVGCKHHNLIEIATSLSGAEPSARKSGACSVPGCEAKAHAKGMCQPHYANFRRTGDARPTTIRLNEPPESEGGVRRYGRRVGLHAQDPVDVVQRWLDRAVERLETMPDSCSLDVADRGETQLVDVAELLGVTTAAIKDEVGPAGERLREGLAEWRDHVPEDHTSNLGRLQQDA